MENGLSNHNVNKMAMKSMVLSTLIIGLIKSVQSKQFQPEEEYEVQGDTQSGKTKAPSRGREEVNKRK